MWRPGGRGDQVILCWPGNTAYYINVLLTSQVAALSNCQLVSNVKYSHTCVCMYVCVCIYVTYARGTEAQDTPPIRHLLNVLAFPATIKLTWKTEISLSLLNSRV